MRSFEQRKAEVLKRSAAAIEERKKSVRAVFTVCAVLVLCITTVMTLTVLPDMIRDKNGINGETADSQDVGASSAVPDVSNNSNIFGESDHISDVGDAGSITDTTTPPASATQAAFTYGGSSVTVTDPETVAQIDRLISDVILSDQDTYGGADTVGVLTVTVDGIATTYPIFEKALTYEGKRYVMEEEQWQTLLSLLGIDK